MDVPDGMSLGILGGSFNPIHNGHLYMARQARDTFGFDRVCFLPTGTPPHKPEGLADAGKRLEMVRIAISGEPGFFVSTLEMERPGNSYTVDTLRQIRAGEAGCALFLIIGADTLVDLLHWREPEQVFQMAGFVVCARPGVREEEMETCAEKLRGKGADIRIMPLEGPDISSTEIRRRIAAGLTLENLVPVGVEAYLRQTGLYRGPIPAVDSGSACSGSA